MGAHECQQLVLTRRSLRTHLGEARGDHADRLHPGRERALHRVEHALARNTDHREVDGRGNVGDRGVATDAPDRLAAAVHGIRGAGEVRMEDIPKKLATDRAASG